MSKVIAAVLGVVTVIAVTVAVGIAQAEPLKNPQEGAKCTTGSWHFVHNQTPAGVTTGTLFYTIGGTEFSVGNDTSSPSANLHYNVDVTGLPITNIHDDVTGGNLVLSDCPKAHGPPPPPPPPPPPTAPIGG